MIYLDMNGRLGSQMFRYAFARNLQELYGKEAISINFNEVEEKGNKENGWENALKYFNVIPFIINNRKKTSIIEYTTMMQKLILLYYLKIIVPHHPEKKDKYAHILNKNGIYMTIDTDPLFTLGKSKNKFLLGHFENPLYFDEIKDLLIDEFTPKFDILPKNVLFYQEILNSNSVCITINKGDFMEARSKSIYQVCTEQYFYEAMEAISKKVYEPKFIIFSDDIAWVKRNMHFDYDVLYEMGSDPVYEKLRLMYSCKHFIISNSTFSWWAQYLGRYKNKVVVSPNRWFKNNWESDLIDPEWILIDIDKLPPSKIVINSEIIRDTQKPRAEKINTVEQLQITRDKTIDGKDDKKAKLEKQAKPTADMSLKETKAKNIFKRRQMKETEQPDNINRKRKETIPLADITKKEVEKIEQLDNIIDKEKNIVSDTAINNEVPKKIENLVQEDKNIDIPKKKRPLRDKKPSKDLEKKDTQQSIIKDEETNIKDMNKNDIAEQLKNLDIPQNDETMTDTEEIEKLKARYMRKKKVSGDEDTNNGANNNGEDRELYKRKPMQGQASSRRKRRADFSSLDSSIEQALQERLQEEKNRLQKDKQKITNINSRRNNAAKTIDEIDKIISKDREDNKEK